MKYRIKETEGKFYPQSYQRHNSESHISYWANMSRKGTKGELYDFMPVECDTLSEARDYIKAIPPEPKVTYHKI